MTRLFEGTRRNFLQLSLVGMAAFMAKPAMAMVPNIKGSRHLAFYNLHTDERLEVEYWKDGRYSRSGAAQIDHLMRDHYTNETYPIDLRLMDLLHDLQLKLNNRGDIEIISAYRSPRTNMMLADMSDGVAKHSYHTKGMALDIRCPGTSLVKLFKTAQHMGRGGVGYYPDSEFVHIDVGPVRQW